MSNAAHRFENLIDEVTREKNRLVDAAASREHALLELQDRVNEMEQERIAGVSHAMLRKAFMRDDRDLLLDLGRRLAAEVAEAARNAGAAYPGQDHWYRGRSDLASELLALFPDDLL